MKKAIEAKKLPQLLEVLHENRRLWRALATDVADADNLLPKELRARIFYLYEFTSHHTSLVIRNRIT